jgi:hypothetical protein
MWNTTLFSGLKPAPHVESVLKHVTLFSGLKPAPHVKIMYCVLRHIPHVEQA